MRKVSKTTEFFNFRFFSCFLYIPFSGLIGYRYQIRFHPEEDTYAGIEDGTDQIHAIEDSGEHDFIDRTSYIIRAGLCGAHEYVSLESPLYPGKFWRHQNSDVKLHDRINEDLFKMDSCFLITKRNSSMVPLLSATWLLQEKKRRSGTLNSCFADFKNTQRPQINESI